MQPIELIANVGRIYSEKTQEFHQKHYDGGYIKALATLGQVIKKENPKWKLKQG